MIQPPSPTGFSREGGDRVADQLERAEAARGAHRGDGRLPAVAAVELDRGADVDVADAVAVGQAESLVVAADIATRLAAARRSCVSGPVSTSVTLPVLGVVAMDLHRFSARSMVTSDMWRA